MTVKDGRLVLPAGLNYRHPGDAVPALVHTAWQHILFHAGGSSRTWKRLAAVRLNGKDLGVMWTAPWTVEITKAVKAKGELSGVRYCESLDKPIDWQCQTSSCKPVYKNQCCAGSGMAAASFRKILRGLGAMRRCLHLWF